MKIQMPVNDNSIPLRKDKNVGQQGIDIRKCENIATGLGASFRVR
jgi:hypothetical protein